MRAARVRQALLFVSVFLYLVTVADGARAQGRDSLNLRRIITQHTAPGSEELPVRRVEFGSGLYSFCSRAKYSRECAKGARKRPSAADGGAQSAGQARRLSKGGPDRA